MLDIKFLRENPDVVKQNIKNKFQDRKLPLVDEVIALDKESRATHQEADELRALASELDGETVTEVTFAAGGQTWRYRMMPTADVTEHIPDISGYTGGQQTAEGQVLWCAASLRWDEGGTGCIIWKDVVPGLAYSLTADSGATETLLIDMAAQVFQPAQDEAG